MSPARLPRSELLPLAAFVAMTALWGSTFFLIKDLLTRLPALDLLAVRFAIAGVAVALLAGRRLALPRRELAVGVGLGLLYGAAQVLQTVGLARTPATVSGFITGLYVVATPLLAALVLRVRTPATTWVAAGLATAGLAALSLRGFSIGTGELLTLASALVYAGHILALGRFSRPGSALGLSAVQLLVVAAVCTVAAVWPGVGAPGLSLPAGAADWWAMLYLALAAGAVTMVLQTWAQARVEPSRAAVIMAMEPVWAAAFAVALGGETITVRLVIGGASILAAMYLVEVAPRRARSKEPVR